jgi:4-aminobutyrate--pyruvate transaminase
MVIMKSNSARERDIEGHMHPQTDARLHEEIGPMLIEKGDGIYIVDSEGNRYIEGMAGLWCASLGFSERRLAEAAYKQSLSLPYQQIFAHRGNQPTVDLAHALLAKAPGSMSKVLFQCSGSEAVDTAIKLVWYYQAALGRPEKRKIISRLKSYHGTTIAAASLTGLPNMHKGFGIPIDGFITVTAPHAYRNAKPGESDEEFASRLAAELEETILSEGPETIGAFFAEPVMGTGGVLVPPATYFEKVQAVLKKYDVLFVADEVICGFGRTGEYWGSDAMGIKPDMLTCAKGLSSAYFPISALLISDEIYQVMADRTHEFGGFGHGFTYGGHPVGAAVALETLKIYEEMNIAAKVKALEPQFLGGLRRFANHPIVGEARGIGLMGALEFVADKATKAPFDPSLKIAQRVSDALRKRGVLLRALGDSLVCAPPLIITPAEIDVILKALGESLDEVASSL